MANPTGTKVCADTLIATLLEWDISIALPGVGLLGACWGYWTFDKATPTYVFCRPVLVNEMMIAYASRLSVDIIWAALSEPAVPPEQVYWDLTYGVRSDGETLGSDQDPYMQAPVNALDATNMVKKRTRFNLVDEFTGKEGGHLAISIGRDSIDPLDTFGGNVGVLGAYLMKRGDGE